MSRAGFLRKATVGGLLALVFAFVMKGTVLAQEAAPAGAPEAVLHYFGAALGLGMIVIGLLWVLMDRTLFTPIERRTVARWGLLQR